MIDVITARGTSNPRGVFKGMTGAVAKKLNPAAFRFYECIYPATIGQIGAAPGEPAVPMDACIDIAVEDLVRQTRLSPNRVGLISYSLGGIAVSRFLEAVEAGTYRMGDGRVLDVRNANGSKLDVAFTVNIANPCRREGEHVVPVSGSGLHSSHGKWPAEAAVYELADNRDIICAAPKYSPLRKIAGHLSPYSALEQNETDPFRSLDAVKSTDWLSRLREGSYIAAVAGLIGYLVPYGAPGRTTHTAYSVEQMPGSHLTWTDWAAEELNRRYAK